MAKMVSGILARDYTPAGWITFFRGAEDCDMTLERSGLWLFNDTCVSDYLWQPRNWRTTYNLRMKPPAKGECFEVEIEL